MLSGESSGETRGTNGGTAKMFLGGLILGAAIGGVVALLYAPMKGEDTRRLVKQKAMQFKEQAGDMVNEVKDTAMDMKKRGQDTINCIKENAT
jgi:gas vesicle protein